MLKEGSGDSITEFHFFFNFCFVLFFDIYKRFQSFESENNLLIHYVDHFSVDPYTCHEIKIQYPYAASGIFQVDPTGPQDDVLPFEVYCDLDSVVGKNSVVVNSNS